MRSNELTTLLAAAIKARKPILITGAPGIGKSDIVAQAATRAKADLIVSHPVVSDPTDAKGLPWVAQSGDHATFLPFGELHQALTADMPTVWFLDDLGQATPATQASFMQLLLARRINGHTLSDHVTFIAATNRRTDRSGVNGILESVKSRFAAIIELTANVDDWSNWALAHNIMPELIAFLRFRPDLLHQFVATQDLVNQPSPRTWTHVSLICSWHLPQSIEFEAIKGAVGEGPASEFVAFLRICRDMPNLDEILLNPSKAVIPDQTSTLYAVATGLAAKANETNFARIAEYCERLHANYHGEFAALCVRDAALRNKKICGTPAYVKLASSELGKMMLGD